MADSRRGHREPAAQDGRDLVDHPAAGRSFANAFLHAPIGMALLDLDGHALQVNQALCRITGYAPGELREKTLHELTHPDDLDLDADDLRQLLSGEISSYQVEKRYRHHWGHTSGCW